MSDSTTEVAAAAAAGVQADADAAAAAALAADPPAPAAPEGGPSAEETAAAEAAAAEAAKKPTRADRHVANLTRKAADEARRAEAAERRAEAAEALLAAGKTDEPLKTPTRAEPDREALRAEIRFNDRLGEIDAAGKKELGADAWETAKATLTGLGAVKNIAFLQALAETEHPAQIFAAMADDTDALVELLARPPAAMAARLGRLDAGFAKPAPKALSDAPKPAAKVDGGGGPPPANIYDPKMSMAEFQREMDKILPPHLGGKRKIA